jgi:hypothetical protein
MKHFIVAAAIVALSGCSLLPRSHDPVMFDRLVVLDIEIKQINCESADWSSAVENSQVLAQAAEWRKDPQAENLDGLHKHTIRMSQGGSVTFCELGKTTAVSRIDATKTAWQGR